MIRNAIQRFMYGRYGNDQLNLFLIVLYFVLYMVLLFLDWAPLYWISLAIFACFVFRLLSRNIPRRREENSRFLRLANPVLRWFRFQRTVHRDKEHSSFGSPGARGGSPSPAGGAAPPFRRRARTGPAPVPERQENRTQERGGTPASFFLPPAVLYY